MSCLVDLQGGEEKCVSEEKIAQEAQEAREPAPEKQGSGAPEIDPELKKGRARKANLIVEAALERSAERPVALDVSLLTAYTDILVVLGGGSDRQVRSIAENVVKTLKEAGEPPLGIEGVADGRWVLVDANDAIVHIFDPEAREIFKLEELWSDAPEIELDPALLHPGAGSDE
jgi:ribosome-associated protein